MKKRLVGLLSVIFALIMSISFLGGCNLITVDQERDLNQVVATIKISEDAKEDKIYKKDLVMSYLNYGYTYESVYGYTREQTMNLIVNQLISSRVYLQNAVIEINTDAKFSSLIKNADKSNWDLTKYLDEFDEIDVNYQAKKQINDFIDSYVEKDELVGDTLIETLRPSPSNAENAEKELSIDDKESYTIDTNSTLNRQKAFNEVIEILNENDLLGKNFKGDITTTTYYENALNSIRENKVMEAYENAVKADARNNITFENLKEVYANNYQSQEQMTDAEFSEKLSSATIDNPVLIGKNGSYGYVYNLLLGANDAQKAEIANIKTTDIAKRAEERKTILADTIVKDLRSSWIISGYDFDENSKQFTGDYAFLNESFPFQGEVTWLNQPATNDADYRKQFSVDAVTEFTLDEFIAEMEEYIYGNDSDNAVVADANPSVYKKVNATSANPNYDERINELLFAFSTDDGSLNTYKGYAIEPTPEDGKEKYMQEFADAGRELLNLGGKSYIMVATDYGYHVMFYSQTFNNDGYETLVSYLNFLSGESLDETAWKQKLKDLVDDWDNQEDNDTFLYKFFDSVATTKVNNAFTKIQNALLNKHVYNENGGVTRYPDRYEDLMEM